MVKVSSEFLTRRRVTAAAVVLFVIEAAIFTLLALATHGYFGPMNPPGASDFLSFYSAGLLADQGQAAAAYDQTRHWAMERLVFGDARVPYYFYFYPPVFTLLCAALARLPYLVAFCLFQASTLGLFLVALRRIAGAWRLPLLSVTFTAVPFVIGLGQNAFLSTALLGTGLVLLERRPFAAGLAWGALCFKPTLLPMLPLALVAGRHGRALAGMAVAAVAVTGLSLVLFGLAPWRAYWGDIAVARATFASGAVPFTGLASLFGAARLLGGSIPVATIVHMAGAIAAAIVLWLVWRRPTSLEARALALVGAGLAATPVILFYDLLPATIAIACVAAAARDTGYRPWERPAFAAIWVIPGLVIAVGEALRIPIGPVVPTLLLALGLRRQRGTRAAENGVDATARPVLNAGLP
jgi:hypothetical protein